MEEKKNYKSKRISKEEMDALSYEIDSSLERFIKEGRKEESKNSQAWLKCVSELLKKA